MGKDSGTGMSRRRFLGAAGVMAAGPAMVTGRARAAESGRLSATVTVEPEPVHALPRTQYGHFIEHLGQCIKGGIWAEGESEDMFLGGVRRELVEAMRSIQPALIRYPGGCFADGYHWQDGIGPRSSRPARKNRAWAKLGPALGPREDNHFGTDEFYELCGAVGAEPMLTVNVGSGTAAEAAAWVDYCNGPQDSKWGAERARNGHPEPYRVKYWFIGNEIFGWHEIGHQRPSEYVHTVRDYARAMRAVDPDVKLIAVGGRFPGAGEENPNRVVLEGAGEAIDYLSIHRYVPLPSSLNTFRYQVANLKGSRSRSIYYDVIGSLAHMEDYVEKNAQDVRTWSPAGKPVPLSFDEYNLWFNFYLDIIIANYNLRDGLWTAGMLNLFHRHAPDLPLANIAQMVNCLGIINSTRAGTFLTPSALAFKLYTSMAGESLLPSAVDGPRLPHETMLPALDVSATRTGDRVALFLVNRHYDAELELAVKLNGLRVAPRARVREIYHPNPAQYNTVAEPEAVVILEREAELEVRREKTASAFPVLLQPHSLVGLELDVEGT